MAKSPSAEGTTVLLQGNPIFQPRSIFCPQHSTRGGRNCVAAQYQDRRVAASTLQLFSLKHRLALKNSLKDLMY